MIDAGARVLFTLPLEFAEKRPLKKWKKEII